MISPVESIITKILRFNVWLARKWWLVEIRKCVDGRWLFYYVQDKQDRTHVLFWNVISRTVPNKATLELTNNSNFLHIKNVQLIKIWTAPLGCVLAKAVPVTAS